MSKYTLHLQYFCKEFLDDEKQLSDHSVFKQQVFQFSLSRTRQCREPLRLSVLIEPCEGGIQVQSVCIQVHISRGMTVLS